MATAKLLFVCSDAHRSDEEASRLPSQEEFQQGVATPRLGPSLPRQRMKSHKTVDDHHHRHGSVPREHSSLDRGKAWARRYNDRAELRRTMIPPRVTRAEMKKHPLAFSKL